MNILMSKIQQLNISLHTYLDNAKRRSEMEDIHKLRVTIRKLKVLYALVEFSLPDEFSKIGYSAAFKDLFSRAGRVRENQINTLYIQRLEQQYLQPYLNYLSRALKRNLRNLKKSIENFELEKFDEQCESVMNLLAGFDDDWCLEKIFAYSSYKFDKTQMLETSLANELILHKARKRVRSIIDVLSMLKKSTRKSSPVPLTSIKKVNDELGKWHDEVVLFHSLELFERRYSKEANPKRLKAYIGRQDQKLDSYMQFILDELSRLK